MSQALAKADAPDMMGLLQLAISKDSAIDVIERLGAMQKEARDHQAKVDFNESMQRVQEKMRPIGADLHNPQTKSRYASYAKLDKALRPMYSAEGFALSFNTAESHLADHIRVMCDVSRGGFSKSYQIDMPNDGKGAKGGDVMTKTHATGAAASYGMRYLLKMIFNVAIGEDDTDGNSSEPSGFDEADIVAAIDTIQDGDTPPERDKRLLAAEERFNHHEGVSVELMKGRIGGCKALPELQAVYGWLYKRVEKFKDKNAMGALMGAKTAVREKLSNAS